jgi:hypothetical protein
MATNIVAYNDDVYYLVTVPDNVDLDEVEALCQVAGLQLAASSLLRLTMPQLRKMALAAATKRAHGESDDG